MIFINLFITSSCPTMFKRVGRHFTFSKCKDVIVFLPGIEIHQLPTPFVAFVGRIIVCQRTIIKHVLHVHICTFFNASIILGLHYYSDIYPLILNLTVLFTVSEFYCQNEEEYPKL